MYEEYYGLRGRPFLTVPDPEFLYWSEGHTLAFTMLCYGVMTRAPVTVITGDVGAGKTTLLRQLISELPEGELEVGLISNMQKGRGELLHWVMMALDQPIENIPYVELFRRFQDLLIRRYAEGKRVVLIFDEAQNLGAEALEELRMLTNINADKDELLQLILVGQPQLRDLLNHPDMLQFAQRISSDYTLRGLSADEVAKYIERRLEVAGASWQIFPRRTAELIHEATGGIPRLVNILCDLCLVHGYAEDRKVIEEDILRDFLAQARARGIYTQFAPLGTQPKLVQQK